MATENSTTKKWSLIIKSTTPWLDLHLHDIWRYRDLLLLFVKRDFVAFYRQTILGPLWFLFQPLITTIMFVVIFSKVAHFSTAGIPPPVFYLSGLVIWNYFASCLNTTSTTFTTHANLFGKVYFPRLLVPLSNVISSLLSFGIQILLLVLLALYYHFFQKAVFHLSAALLLVPVILVFAAFLGLGSGIIISALTTKYRDLTFLVSFGVQLLMYTTPVIYQVSFFNPPYDKLLLLNPVTPMIEVFRYSLFGVGTLQLGGLLYSFCITTLLLFTGIVLFTRIEKGFMDVV